VKLTNDGKVSICVNGLQVAPGDSVELVMWMGDAPQHELQGGLQATVCVNAGISFENVGNAIPSFTREELGQLRVFLNHHIGTLPRE